MPNFYYRTNPSERIGPLTDAQFRELADSGGIQDDTEVWWSGMPDFATWKQVRSQLGEPSPAEPGSGDSEPAEAGDTGMKLHVSEPKQEAPPPTEPAAPPPMKACRSCSQVFPSNLMRELPQVRRGGAAGWLCAVCADQEMKAVSTAAMYAGKSDGEVKFRKIVLVGVALFATAIALKLLLHRGSRQALGEAVRSNEPAEPWASAPLARWPQLTVRGSAVIGDAPSVSGFVYFLARTHNDAVVAVTAAEPFASGSLGAPAIKVDDLPAKPVLWITTPPGVLEIGGFWSSPTGNRSPNVLTLKVTPQPQWPVPILKARKLTMQDNEAVYIAIPGAPGGSERFVPGVASRPLSLRSLPDRRSIEGIVTVQTALESADALGAPIVDGGGRLCGIVSAPNPHGTKVPGTKHLSWLVLASTGFDDQFRNPLLQPTTETAPAPASAPDSAEK